LLNRTALPLTHPPEGLTPWQRSLGVRPIAQPAGGAVPLLRFLLVLILLCGLTSLYLWQTSIVTQIQQETRELNLANAEYEKENVELMLQVARWHGPEYIFEGARSRGMQPLQGALRPNTNIVYSITTLPH